jgi:hypothetical protein
MIVVTLTWVDIVVWAIISIVAYCIFLVAYSYTDHPAVTHWINGSDDYRRWKDEP